MLSGPSSLMSEVRNEPVSVAALGEPDAWTFGIVAAALREWIIRLVRVALGLFDKHVGAHGPARIAAILFVYAVDLAAVFWVAYELRWDFSIPPEFVLQCLTLIVPVVACKLLLLESFGQFRSIMSYFGLADFFEVVLSMTIVSGCMFALWFWAALQASPPRGVILMDFVLSVGIISASRLSLRVMRTRCSTGTAHRNLAERRVAIIGAGDAGEALANDLLQHRGSGVYPIFFIDDDPKMIGRSIHGLPVFGPLEKLAAIAAKARIDELVISLPNAGPKRVKEIVEIARQLGAATQIVPSFTQLASGEVKVDRFRPVAIEDLLGRAPVDLDSEGIGRLIRDRIVLVTGAGGSIGSELCRQILGQGPRQLVMVEQTEFALFEIERELAEGTAGGRIVPLITDVADEAAMRAVFTSYKPEIVFHAAAHKHVPLMERQPAEALKNNTLATAAVTRLASENGVDRFVFVSTDKAINPSSVMGCSKRMAEKAVQAQQDTPGNRTTFLAVRFGNVLGSSGSVIPTFRRQIAQGGPVTVTHPEMVRYFMTITESVGLVLQTATLGRGGEIFILDMGQPVKIVDLARQMIELSGYRPDTDIEIKFTGVRRGEKLYEELRHTEESHEPTEHPRIFKLKAERVPTDSGSWLAELAAVVSSGSPSEMKATMRKIVPEYTPAAD
jgi:FlaA1/EpsC-like NDP-sugar epimerase